MFTSVNPATGEAGETFAELTAEEIEAKVAAANQAYRAWRTTDLTTRSALLVAIADQFETNKHRLAAIATREMGKTLKSAIAEVEKCIAGFRHYATAGPAMLEPRAIATATGPATARFLPLS